jgi:hypothetical protein
MSAKLKPGAGRIESVLTDPVDFVATTITTITGMIRPNLPVTCIRTDMQSLTRTPKYPIITHYQARAIVQGEVGGALESLPCIMFVDRARVLGISSQAGLVEGSLCYWNIVFEGVRRFVQEHVLAPDDLLPFRLLQGICEKSNEIDILRDRLVQGFYVEGGATPEQLRTEVDVQTSAIITQAAMMNIVRSRGQVLYEELIPFLTMGKGVLTPSVEKGILSFFE